jgi:hypothetical protein
MPGKIPFPFSAVLLLAVVPAVWGYLAAGRLSGAAPRRVVRAALVGAVLALPLTARGPGPVQLALGLLAGYLGIRLAALGAVWRDRGSVPSLAEAAAAATSIDDVLQPAPPDPARRLPRALALGLFGVAACVALLAAGAGVRLWRASRFADNLLVCLEVALGTMGINNLILAAAAAGGHSVAGLEDRPALSASLSEFWSARWNRLVGRNLHRGFFRPLCRRGYPRLGVAASFVASGVMHVVPVLAAMPLARAAGPAASVMGFFLLHAGLVLGERALGWHRAPPPGPGLAWARLRTLTVFVALSPLLLGPFADICGVHGR